MTTHSLLYPVTDLEGHELLPQGAELNDKTLDELISGAKPAKLRLQSVAMHNTISKDLRRFLSIPPYHIIFSEQTNKAYVLSLLEKLRLPIPLLKILDYFKENHFHTYRHSLIVYVLSALLAKVLNAEEKTPLAGPVHDIGLYNVPYDILNQESPLTEKEDNIVKHHAHAGYVLLCYYFRDRNCISARMALKHHELLSRTGYPHGIKQTNQSVEIIALSSIYDALISNRPFRPLPFKNREALEKTTSMAENGEITWKPLQALIALNRGKGMHKSNVIVSKERREFTHIENTYGARAAS